MRIARDGRLEGRQFRGPGLAQNHRAGALEQRHAGGVGGGPDPGMNRRAAFRRHVAGIDDVLYPDRNAVQRPAPWLPVPVSRSVQRPIRVEEGPCPYLAVAKSDALEASAHQHFRGQPAFGHPPGQLANRRKSQVHLSPAVAKSAPGASPQPRRELSACQPVSRSAASS